MQTTTSPPEEMKEPPCFLLLLPTELVERIACHADDAFPKERPLSKLRSTCRQLHDQVSPEFAKRYLSEPFIMMSRYSLEALVSICKHHVFGPKVRKVRLHAFPQFVGESKPIHTFLKTVASQLRFYPGLLRQNPRVYEDIKGIVKEDVLLRSSGEALELLTKAFESLAEHKVSVVLVSETYDASEDVKAKTPPIGYDANVMNIVREVQSIAETADHDCKPALHYLLQAASRTGCSITGTEINACHDYSPASAESFLRLPLSSDETRLLFGTRSAFITIDGARYRSATEESLHTFLLQVKNITQLKFHSVCHVQDREYDCKYLGRLLRLIDLLKLQSLSLDGFVTSSQDLKNFLARHKGTLKEIKLTNIMILDDWVKDRPLRETFAWIRDELTLERILISDIYAAIDDPLMYETLRVPWHLGQTELEGESVIRSGLTDLCDEDKRLENLFMREPKPYSTDWDTPVFAAMAGLSEGDFVDDWCSDGNKW